MFRCLLFDCLQCSNVCLISASGSRSARSAILNQSESFPYVSQNKFYIYLQFVHSFWTPPSAHVPWNAHLSACDISLKTEKGRSYVQVLRGKREDIYFYLYFAKVLKGIGHFTPDTSLLRRNDYSLRESRTSMEIHGSMTSRAGTVARSKFCITIVFIRLDCKTVYGTCCSYGQVQSGLRRPFVLGFTWQNMCSSPASYSHIFQMATAAKFPYVYHKEYI